MAEEELVLDLRADIDREQWSLLLQNVRASAWPMLLIGALYAGFFSHFAGAPQTWLWWLALAAAVAARWWVTRPQVPRSALAMGLFYLTQFGIGVLWGLAPIVIDRLGDEVMLFTALLLATSMAMAAFGSYGINLPASMAVAVPIAALNLALIAVSGQPAYIAAGIALLLLYGYQAVVMAPTRRMLEHQIRLRVENSLMAAQLSAQAEKTAAELDRRMDMERQLRASRDRAERMSATDSLTEIANRRYFDKRLKAEASRAFRDHSNLSLIVCDIDYFKQFNDLYGHQQGDACLKAFARILESYCRRGGDLAARIGGEEFAILLPATEHGAALKLAEQVRAAFDALAVKHEGSSIKANVTGSFGVSTIVPERLDASETLMRNADRALYAAKAKGRNQVASGDQLEVAAAAVE